MTNQLVTIQNNQSITTSLHVVDKFKKRHDNVIRDIENLLQSPDIQSQLYFEVSEYKDTTGKTNKMYIMNRDGFTLLAMGFTGQAALKFKLDYIQAFNKMEAHIRSQQAEPEVTERSRSAISAGEHFFIKSLQSSQVSQHIHNGRTYWAVSHFCTKVLGVKYNRLPVTLKRIEATPGQTSIIRIGSHNVAYADQFALTTYLKRSPLPKAANLLSMVSPQKQLAS